MRRHFARLPVVDATERADDSNTRRTGHRRRAGGPDSHPGANRSGGRRPGPPSSSSPRIGSTAEPRVLLANDWRANTSPSSLRAPVPSPCQGTPTCSCRSSSRPERGTADPRSRFDVTAPRPELSTTPRRCRRSPSRTMRRSAGRWSLRDTASSYPSSQDFGYDSYAGLDVKDKIVVVLHYFPEDAEPNGQSHPRALLRPPLQGAGGTPARRQGTARRHGATITERRPGASHELRHGALGFGDSCREHQRHDGAPRCLTARRSRWPMPSRNSIRAIRMSAASPCRRRSTSRRAWCARSRPDGTSSPISRRRRPGRTPTSRG